MQQKPISGSSISKKHFTFLDGIRACAAIYVLVHHAFMYIQVPQGSLVALVAKPFSNGHSAVNVFIIISGFCLMYPLLASNMNFKNGIMQFYTRRAKRILPPYYITIGICLLLSLTILSAKTGTQWDGTLYFTNWDLLARFFLVQDIFYDTHAKINYSLWSVAVECHIYLLFPLIIFSWKKLGGVFTMGAAIICSIAIWHFILPYKQLNITRSGINPHYLALFVFGIAAAYITHAISGKQKLFARFALAKICITAVILLALLTVAKHYYSVHSAMPQFVLNDLREGVFTAVLLIFVSSNNIKWLQQLLSSKILTSIGAFSYTIYLLHPPLLQLFTQYVMHPLHLSATAQVITMVLVGCPLVVVGSYLLFFVVERPFMNQAPSLVLAKPKWYLLQRQQVEQTIKHIRSNYSLLPDFKFFQLKNWP